MGRLIIVSLLSVRICSFWWARRESNPQSVRNTILSRARIPVPPLAHARFNVRLDSIRTSLNNRCIVQ